jgi:hypothetical protein
MSTVRSLKMRFSVSRQPFDIVDGLREGIAKRQNVLGEARGHVEVHAAGTEVIGVQAGARDALVKLHEPLALFEAPQKRGDRADIEPERADAQQMV